MKKLISIILSSIISVTILAPSLFSREFSDATSQKREVLAENPNQIYVAVHDFLPVSTMVSLFAGMFAIPAQTAAGAEYIYAGTMAPGGYELGYERIVGSWALGGQVSYTPFISYQRHKDTGEVSVSGRTDYVGACASAKYYYVAKPKFRFYLSMVGGALVPVGNTESGIVPAFQINPLCIRFGGQKFGGFAELGIGDLGLTRFGLEYSF